MRASEIELVAVGALAPFKAIGFITRLLLLTIPAAAVEEPIARPNNRPNVVLIMADDMGYEALSVNGSESCQSPNLDKLAAQGVRFSNGFANPLCTPSRAKIMTGQYNVRNYVKFGLLDRGQTTFAHQLKAAGYATCIAGKWQLGTQMDSPQHFEFEQSCLRQHTRSGRPKQNGKTIDRRFVNPMLEFNGKEKDWLIWRTTPEKCGTLLMTPNSRRYWQSIGDCLLNGARSLAIKTP